MCSQSHPILSNLVTHSPSLNFAGSVIYKATLSVYFLLLRGGRSFQAVSTTWCKDIECGLAKPEELIRDSKAVGDVIGQFQGEGSCEASRYACSSVDLSFAGAF